MRYRILGPLEVLDDGEQPVHLGGQRERVLLAALLLQPNRVVSSDRLIGAVWGELPPDTAANALQVHISKLRKALASHTGSDSPLRTQSPGYLLRTSHGELDAELFEELAADSRPDEGPAEVSIRLAEALNLWRGEVLDGLEIDASWRSDLTFLEELHVSVLERRIEADLAIGRHHDLIGELEGLVHTHPLREELRGQLMLALYRSGRQAEALRVYRQTREVLGEELGIEPSRALQNLELAILNQAPELKSPENEDKATTVASSRPTGTVTLLFTDIEGSTRMWDQTPVAMEESLKRHDELLRSAIEGSGGYVFTTAGDAFCAAFSTAKDAVSAAIEAQRSLSAEQWPQGLVLRARMALHTGECEERGGDYFGPLPNRVARLESVAHGGQIVVSRSTADIVREGLPPGVALRELGTHRLKDLSRPEEVFQLVTDDLDADFPPLKSLDNPGMPNNLPEFVSSFVGRGAEVDEVGKVVGQSRLVTLAGPGGVGKTRLALQVAAELVDGSGDGVWLVELANVSDPDAVPMEVARSLRINKQGAGQIIETLVEALADQYVLIVLDNCEHLIGASAKLADVLLRACPRVSLLITSREPLGIDGETVFRVSPLSLPDQDSDELSVVETSGAVTLFVERARAHTPDFAVTGESAPLVAAICRRLDGMPLAIELAVARLRSLSLADLNDRLDRRFQLLTGGSRSALPRNQTLRGVVDWSYELLTEPEQVLLTRLSVFSAGFELGAAEEICGFGAIEDFDVTVLLGGLVDKSLVVTDASTFAIRYRLLETIRQYSAERLADVDPEEIRRLFDAYADFYMKYAENAAPQLGGPDQAAQVARLGTEYPNLYSALEHLSKRSDQRDHALRLAVALRHYWHIAGASGGEILLLNEVSEQRDSAITDSLMAAGLLCKADLLRGVDLPASVHFGSEALKFARSCGDPNLLADALSFHSFSIVMLNGYSEEAVLLAQEAIGFARQCGDPVLTVAALNCLASALEGSDSSQAESFYAESIAVGERSGNWDGLWRSHNNLASLLLLLGRFSEAREHLESALVFASKIGSERYAAFSRGNLAWILFRQGETNEARTNFVLCMRNARRSGLVRRIMPNVACGLACCATRDGYGERAATLHGVGQSALDVFGGGWDLIEQPIRDADIAQLRLILGDSFERCYENGMTMGREEAISFLLRP